MQFIATIPDSFVLYVLTCLPDLWIGLGQGKYPPIRIYAGGAWRSRVKPTSTWGIKGFIPEIGYIPGR